MAEAKTPAFEEKVARLEAIVKELEGGNVELDRAVALFKEGKTIAGECEKLLSGAQEQIDRAMGAAATSAARPHEDDIDDIPF